MHYTALAMWLLDTLVGGGKKINVAVSASLLQSLSAQQSTSLAFNKWLRVNLFEKQQIGGTDGKTRSSRRRRRGRVSAKCQGRASASFCLSFPIQTAATAAPSPPSSDGGNQ